MIDTEFRDDGVRFDAISIALVSSDSEYYAVFADCDIDAVIEDPWLRRHVVPHLPLIVNDAEWAWNSAHVDHSNVKPRSRIAADVRGFVTRYPDPELWALFSPYDHIIYTQLYGRFDDLPPEMPAFTRDLLQEAKRRQASEPAAQDDRHHALTDARHNLAIAAAIGLLFEGPRP